MPQRVFDEQEIELIREVFATGRLSALGGGEVAGRFERAFADAMGAQHGVAMNSAMSVLHSSVMAAGAGVGDEVICDSVMVFGAVATMYNCAIPVFVDIDPVTLGMNPDLIEEKITERTKAIITTHCWGLMAEMDRICEIAKKHGLLVIEDCAQALFAEYKGKYAGTWGDIGSFSFQMSKQLGLGDGGMGVTDSEELRDKLGLNAGAPTFMSIAYDLHYNYRMTEPMAAIGLVQLDRVRGYIEGLQANAKHYDAAVEGCEWLKLQAHPDGVHTYHAWVAIFEGDDAGVSLDEFKRVKDEVGFRAGVGYTQLPAYKHPLIAERKGYGRGFPLDNPLYAGEHNQYPDGLCPVAERVVPRMIHAPTFIAEDSAKANADRLWQVVEMLSG